MVILGGLEIVAAGYLYHKHQQNKKDRALLAEEEAAIEEEEYRRRHKSEHRRHRSHSRRRHSRERRNSYSYDNKYEYRPRPTGAERPSSRPERPIVRPMMRPVAPQQIPQPTMAQQSNNRPPPPYTSVPTATTQPPQDIKYGWTDEPAQPQSAPQDSGYFPPTGWPAHWPQTQTPDTGARFGSRTEPSRGRLDNRATSASPRVRFAVPRNSPPPSYRK